MRRRWLAVLALSTLMVVSPAAMAQEQQPVDGFLHADSPLQLSGDIQHRGAGETLFITTEQARDELSLELSAEELRVTQVSFEVQTAEAPGPVNLSVTPPADDSVQRETTRFENATLAVDAFEPGADLVVYPTATDPLLTEASSNGGAAQLDIAPDGLLVRDGYRERDNVSRSERHEFDWSHELQGPQLTADGLSPIQMEGSLRSYAWNSTLTVENETTTEQYETGYEERERQDGTVRSEEYTYVLIEAHGVRASLETSDLNSKLFASAMSVSVDGATALSGASGTLETEDGSFFASQPQETVLRGNLSMEVTPKPEAGQERVTISIDGDVQDTTLPLRNDQSLASTETVAAAAGGATAFGLAAWYLTSAKGLSLAAVPFLGARRSRERPASADPEVAVDDPGDLLFDPDRFALYHLIRERPGLTGQTCAETAGVPDAGQQLELMVEHGLLEAVADDPRRYMLPGAVDPEDADRIALLREPGARRVAEILAVHGLAPEAHLLDRVEAADTPLSREGAAELIDRLVEEGLAYREEGPDGRVADSTDALHDLLERMGETSVPRIS